MVHAFQKRILPLGGAILIGALLVLAFSKGQHQHRFSVSPQFVADDSFDKDKGSNGLPIDGEAYCCAPAALHLTAAISSPSSTRPSTRRFLAQDLIVTLRRLLI